MVRNNLELATTQVLVKFFDRKYERQRFLLRNVVSLLVSVHETRGVSDHHFFSILDLPQHCVESKVGCVRVNDEFFVEIGKSQYRFTCQKLLQRLKRFLAILSPNEFRIFPHQFLNGSALLAHR